MNTGGRERASAGGVKTSKRLTLTRVTLRVFTGVRVGYSTQSFPQPSPTPLRDVEPEEST